MPLSTNASTIFTGSLALEDESKVLADYVVGQRLGEGAYGSVYVAKHLPSGASFALKILPKPDPYDVLGGWQTSTASPLGGGHAVGPGEVRVNTGTASPPHSASGPSPAQAASELASPTVPGSANNTFLGNPLDRLIVQEATVMQALEHPHVVKLYKFLSSTSAFYLIMELAEGGELFDLILSKHHFPEDEARHYFQQLISAIDYCHCNGVAHKDLKAENLLLSKDNRLLVCDFGFSSKAVRRNIDDAGDPGAAVETADGTGEVVMVDGAGAGVGPFGTLHYMSPEAIAASANLFGALSPRAMSGGSDDGYDSGEDLCEAGEEGGVGLEAGAQSSRRDGRGRGGREGSDREAAGSVGSGEAGRRAKTTNSAPSSTVTPSPAGTPALSMRPSTSDLAEHGLMTRETTTSGVRGRAQELAVVTTTAYVDPHQPTHHASSTHGRGLLSKAAPQSSPRTGDGGVDTGASTSTAPSVRSRAGGPFTAWVRALMGGGERAAERGMRGSGSRGSLSDDSTSATERTAPGDEAAQRKREKKRAKAALRLEKEQEKERERRQRRRQQEEERLAYGRSHAHADLPDAHREVVDKGWMGRGERGGGAPRARRRRRRRGNRAPVVDPYQQDLWSAGVILFFMLTGRLPFDGRDDEETQYLIECDKVCWTDEEAARISPEARVLVCRMLAPDPTDRPSLQDIIETPWFARGLNLRADFPHRAEELAQRLAQLGLLPRTGPRGVRRIDPAGARQPRSPAGATPRSPSSPEEVLHSPPSSFLDFSVAHPVTESEERAIETAFRKIGTDGYGAITRDELRDMLTTLHGDVVGTDAVSELVNLFTGDPGSREISFTQFRDAWVNKDLANLPFTHSSEFQLANIIGTQMDEVERQIVRELRAAFDSVDTHHIGVMELEELRRVFERCDIPVTESELVSLMKFFDERDLLLKNYSGHPGTTRGGRVTAAKTGSPVGPSPANASVCHRSPTTATTAAASTLGGGSSFASWASNASPTSLHTPPPPSQPRLFVSFDAFVMGVVRREFLLRHPLGRKLAAATNLTALFHSRNVTECVRNGFLVAGLQNVVLEKLASVPERLLLLYSDEVVSNTENIYSFRYLGSTALVNGATMASAQSSRMSCSAGPPGGASAPRRERDSPEVAAVTTATAAAAAATTATATAAGAARAVGTPSSPQPIRVRSASSATGLGHPPLAGSPSSNAGALANNPAPTVADFLPPRQTPATPGWTPVPTAGPTLAAPPPALSCSVPVALPPVLRAAAHDRPHVSAAAAAAAHEPARSSVSSSVHSTDGESQYSSGRRSSSVLDSSAPTSSLASPRLGDTRGGRPHLSCAPPSSSTTVTGRAAGKLASFRHAKTGSPIAVEHTVSAVGAIPPPPASSPTMATSPSTSTVVPVVGGPATSAAAATMTHRMLSFGGTGVVGQVSGVCDVDVILAPAGLGYTLVRFRRIHGKTSDFHEAVVFVSNLLDFERQQAVEDTMPRGESELM